MDKQNSQNYLFHEYFKKLKNEKYKKILNDYFFK